jgi:hypothetical protein
VSLPLAGMPPDFEVHQTPTVAQCLIAVDVANRIRTDVPFSEEMRTYLSTVHLFNGMFCPLPPLDFIEVDADDYNIDCKKVMEEWPKVRRSRRASVDPETPEEEQLLRMLAAYETLEEHRAQIQSQLPLIFGG